jgi:hypothetical protein
MNQILLIITEEYGYRYWIAKMSEEEWNLLLLKWKSILPEINCLVEVTSIIPQALQVSTDDIDNLKISWTGKIKYCHFHEANDSYLEN